MPDMDDRSSTSSMELQRFPCHREQDEQQDDHRCDLKEEANTDLSSITTYKRLYLHLEQDEQRDDHRCDLKEEADYIQKIDLDKMFQLLDLSSITDYKRVNLHLEQDDHRFDLKEVADYIQKKDLVKMFQLLDLSSITAYKRLYLHQNVNFPPSYNYIELLITEKQESDSVCSVPSNPQSEFGFKNVFLLLPSVKSISNSQSIPPTAADIQDLQSAIRLLSYSAMLRRIPHKERRPYLKHRWEQIKSFQQENLFEITKNMRSNLKEVLSALCADSRIQDILLPYLKEYEGQQQQYAFAVAVMKNNRFKFFPPVRPLHKNKDVKVTKHSEELLIEKLDPFLRKHGGSVQCIVIYTLNSPCLCREEQNIVPCMFQLKDKAHQWHSEYEIFTCVIWKNFWGLRGPNCFNHLKYSDISDQNSVFFPYFEKCKGTRFKLDGKAFRRAVNNNNIYQTLRNVEAKDRDKLRRDIKSAVDALTCLAETSEGLKQEHLDRGVEMIQSFRFQSQVQDSILDTLRENWEEMVINSSMSPIREEIATEFNTAIVLLFVQDLYSCFGNNSPLKLFRIE